MSVIKQNELKYELNHENLTCKVIKSPSATNSVYIPRSVLYESKEYIVVRIDNKAFESNQKIFSILFPDNSEVKSIGGRAFFGSTIKFIKLPASLEFLDAEWCEGTQRLTKIEVSPGNKHYQIIDNKHLIMTNETNNSKTLMFVPRNIESITIPSYITRIESECLSNNIFLDTVLFEKNSKLTSIGKQSFCFSNIKKITFPPTLQDLSEDWCGDGSIYVEFSSLPDPNYLKFIDNKYIIKKYNDEQILVYVQKDVVDCVVPSFVTIIGSYSFSSCKSLKTVSFEEGSKLKIIKENAFYKSAIENLSIPSSVEIIEEGFCYCTPNLINIIVSPSNPRFKFIDDSFLTFQLNENEEMIIFARRNIENVIIPSFIKKIANCAFDECMKLISVSFVRNSVLEEIGVNAFSSSALSSISPIPASVKRIGQSAFIYCEILEAVEFEENNSCLVEISNDAFNSCLSLRKASIPKHVKIIGESAFGCCEQLKSISFQEGSELQYIGSGAFSYTEIVDIPIPSGVKFIKEDFLTHDHNVDFDISPENEFIKFFDNFLISKNENESTIIFSNNDVEDVIIPSFVTRIGFKAFEHCNLNSVTFENDSKLTSIASYAFSYSSIRKLEIPENLTFIEDGWCFMDGGLNEIILSPKNKNFKYTDKILITTVHLDQYLTTEVILFAERDIKSVVIPSSVTKIANKAFSLCKNLSSISFDQSSEIVEIGTSSFYNCASLNSIVSIPASLKYVCDFCFNDSRNLTAVEFLSDELELFYGAFFGCTSLSLLSFPNAKKIVFSNFAFFQIDKEITIFFAPNADAVITK